MERPTKMTPLFLLLSLYALLHIGCTGIAASTVRITLPDRDGVNLADLPSIEGTVLLASVIPPERITEVKISVGKQESDEVWAYDSTRRIYRWMTGPTGQWLPTQFNGTTWTAPSTGYTLPSGRDLPEGRYVVHAVLITESGAWSEQARRIFTIRR